MSGIAKVVKKVFKPIKKLASAVWKGVKKVAKSKIFKVALIGAAIYFGGAGLSGMMNGQGFLAGVSNAATSLGQATSSVLGGNFSTAGAHLSAGIKGTTVAANTGVAGSVNAAVAASGKLQAGQGVAYTNKAIAAQNAAQGSQAAITAGGGSVTVPSAAQISQGANVGFKSAAVGKGAAAAGQGAQLANVAGQTASFGAPMTTPTVAQMSQGASVGMNTANAANQMTTAQAIVQSAQTAGKYMLGGQLLQAGGNYLQQRDAEKQAEEERNRRTYFGLNGAGEYTNTGGLNFDTPNLGLIKPPEVRATTLDDIIRGGA